MRRPATTIAVLAALAGCGSDPIPPQEVARNYVAGDDPAKCADVDIGFLERQTGVEGEKAREECRRSVERARPPRDVRVRSTKVDGNRAEVLLEASGQRLTVTLRRLDNRWRVTGFE